MSPPASATSSSRWSRWTLPSRCSRPAASKPRCPYHRMAQTTFGPRGSSTPTATGSSWSNGPPGTSRQRQVQRRSLPCLIDGRFPRIAAVDPERDGGADRASGNRVGTHHVNAESGEVLDTPRRGDCAPGRPDVGLHVGTGRQPSVACVEDLTGEPDDGPDTAGGRADREPWVEPRRLAVSGPAHGLFAVDDLVLHECPEEDLAPGRAASVRL